jgi:uncharacterized alpha-E superfamily protein
MRLLSRNAESLFWLARYLERASSLARVIEMQCSFGNQDQEAGWTWLLALHSNEERFKQRFDVTSRNIIAFYLTDMGNIGSIRSSIHWARENARALRPFIPLEMWVQLNAFHGVVENLGPDDALPSQLPRTCALVRAGCLAQIGIAEGTLFRDEGYQFFKLGMLIERADQTSRLLDVKFAQEITSAGSRDTADDFVFWSTILRTAAAYQVFHRLEPTGANPERVARFLILNPSHPRSIGFCVREITESLHVLRHSFRLSKSATGLEACDMMMDGLQSAGSDEHLVDRLHAFNDWVQRSLFTVTDAIDTAFFKRQPVVAVTAVTPVPDVVPAAMPHQSQSQSNGVSSLQGQSQSQRPEAPRSQTQSQSADGTRLSRADDERQS